MAEMDAVLLQEDEATGDRFLVYSTDKGLHLDIRYEGELALQGNQCKNCTSSAGGIEQRTLPPIW